jgi:hypothetical protein
MTIRDLVDNFGNKFGLTIDDTEPYLDVRFINNQPLDNLMNQVESNPHLEADTILEQAERVVRGDALEEPIPKNDVSITDSVEAVGK